MNYCINRAVSISSDPPLPLNAAKRLEAFGVDVCFLPVTEDGVVDLAAAREAIKPGTGLVSVRREKVDEAFASGKYKNPKKLGRPKKRGRPWGAAARATHARGASQ